MRVILRANAFQVFVCRMALITTARAVEINLALLRVAGKCVQIQICPAMVCRVGLHVQPRHNVCYLIFRHVRLWHTLIGASVTNHRAHQEALFIIQHQQGTHQIRRAVRALGRGTMAPATFRHEQGAAAFHGIRVLL